MNTALIAVSLVSFFLSLCSSEVPTETCPPARDGVNGRDGRPGRDGNPGRDGVPGVCLRQDEQAKQIAQLRTELDLLNQRPPFPSGARICAVGSYLAFGFCLPKSPSPYVNHSSCSSGFTLYRGVCYRWPTAPQCQTQDLVTANTLCQQLQGRLCTVPELDRLSGTGCSFDFAGSWALLGLQHGRVRLAYGICFRDDYPYTLAQSVNKRPSESDVVTIASCDAVTSLFPEASSNIKAGVICCKT